jgi:hypothetical protein
MPQRRKGVAFHVTFNAPQSGVFLIFVSRDSLLRITYVKVHAAVRHYIGRSTLAAELDFFRRSRWTRATLPM